jgi:hypothetical protein
MFLQSLRFGLHNSMFEYKSKTNNLQVYACLEARELQVAVVYGVLPRALYIF